jgi:hypothetical protein
MKYKVKYTRNYEWTVLKGNKIIAHYYKSRKEAMRVMKIFEKYDNMSDEEILEETRKEKRMSNNPWGALDGNI